VVASGVPLLLLLLLLLLQALLPGLRLCKRKQQLLVSLVGTAAFL
jgi:hypothetical protein